MYIVSSGVGQVFVFDDDEVCLHNLQRQFIYTEEDIGSNKAETISKKLLKRNSKVKVEPLNERVTAERLDAIVQSVNDKSKVLIVDCSDNYETMLFSHDYALRNHLKFLYGSAEVLQGLVSYYDYEDDNYIERYGCLRCLGFQTNVEKTSNQILGPVAGIIGTFMADQALQILSGNIKNNYLYGKIMFYQMGKMKYLVLDADSECKHKVN
jgi:molybdopterin/thiamine biosynthesis adenylyltransferase